MSNPFAGEQIVEPRREGNAAAWAVGPVFGLLAAYFLFASPRADVPVQQQPLVDRSLIVPGARRQAMGEPPTALVGGFSHACNECHRLFDSPPIERRTLTQHTGITFDHGMNNRCFNCHDRANRERLVMHDGTLIGFDEVPTLCAQCHGTVFRDWQAGTHGKTMGSWNAAGGTQHRLECNDCHDPHAPAYKPIAPLPGPITLRMGDQKHVHAAPERHTPLRRWSSPHDESPAPDHETPADDAKPAESPKEDHP